tara:strand:+ start:794 stop:1051 length:258 start_codon:yes stop_codon:yes gene_type:complete
MVQELENLKKKILYRASYRGTKEMDILLSSFVKQYINKFNNDQLKALETFLEYEDEIILNYYNFDIDSKEISKNTISKIFKDFRV